jgi:hypothetical protein
VGRSQFKGLALHVSDYETDHLHVIGEPWNGGALATLFRLVRAAGGVSVPEAVPNAFEDEGDPESTDEQLTPEEIEAGITPFCKTTREEYREETGRKLPPIMRVKITVEVEVLTDEENEKAWDEHKRVIRAHRKGEPGD